jgi:hypothetical protein
MPKPKVQRTTLYLPIELWKAAKIEAIKRGVTATEVMTLALADYLTKSKSQEARDAATDFKQKEVVAALSTLHPKRKGGRS